MDHQDEPQAHDFTVGAVARANQADATAEFTRCYNSFSTALQTALVNSFPDPSPDFGLFDPQNKACLAYDSETQRQLCGTAVGGLFVSLNAQEAFSLDEAKLLYTTNLPISVQACNARFQQNLETLQDIAAEKETLADLPHLASLSLFMTTKLAPKEMKRLARSIVVGALQTPTTKHGEALTNLIATLFSLTGKTEFLALARLLQQNEACITPHHLAKFTMAMNSTTTIDRKIQAVLEMVPQTSSDIELLAMLQTNKTDQGGDWSKPKRKENWDDWDNKGAPTKKPKFDATTKDDSPKDQVEVDRKANQICLKHLSGRCENGGSCPYLHSYDPNKLKNLLLSCSNRRFFQFIRSSIASSSLIPMEQQNHLLQIPFQHTPLIPDAHTSQQQTMQHAAYAPPANYQPPGFTVSKAAPHMQYAPPANGVWHNFQPPIYLAPPQPQQVLPPPQQAMVQAPQATQQALVQATQATQQ